MNVAPPPTNDFSVDLAAIARMDSVPTMLQLICRTTGMGFAAIARVTEDRWITCAVRDHIAFGLTPGDELPVATTLCNEVRAVEAPIVIDHVAENPRYCGHETPAKYGFQSYISVPIVRSNGEFFGTLCAIDPAPARLSSSDALTVFELLAQLISRNLEADTRDQARELALQAERANAELRERFIAVLGHDLRNPLGAILSAATALQKVVLDPAAAKMTSVILRSSARIGELADNLLDLARSRRGGLTAKPSLTYDLADRLLQVIQEFQPASTEHVLVHDFVLDRPIVCDSRRIEQLLSNLISNAMTHGARPGTIQVVGRTTPEEFVLSVTNSGRPISYEKLQTIFEPFAGQAEVHAGTTLGLGLYICSEIARAHNGHLSVTSGVAHTCFTFRMKSI